MDELRQLIDLGKPFLRQYLLDNGVDITKKGSNEFFSCIHPDHDDENPSSGLVRGSDDEYFHCFSCSCNGDIYNAAHYLEGKPLVGLGFIRENVEYILNKYQVSYDPVELSDEQLLKLKYELVYDSVFNIMTTLNPLTGTLEYTSLEHCHKREWDVAICKQLGVGSIKNYDSFIELLSRKTGYQINELKAMGIRDELFGPDLITFCIRDHTKKIRGFVARYIPWTKGCDKPKYRNTSMDDCPYYHKDRLLYCLDIAKSYNMYRLDIFEGYGSAVTAQQAGYKNCVAIGGTALTEAHVNLVRDLGFQHINLVLDQDDTGSKLMEKYIERFSGLAGMQITVTHLPFSEEDKKVEGCNDPDAFIRKYGISEYRKLKPVGVFEHMLRKHNSAIDLEGNPVFTRDFLKRMIQLIINDSNHIERAEKIAALARVSGLEKDDIRSEIERIEKTDVKNIKDEISRKLRNTTDHDELLDVLTNASHTIQESSSTKKEKYLLSLAETVEVFDEVFLEMNSSKSTSLTWKTGIEAMDELIGGIVKPSGRSGGIAMGIAGPPHHCKSSVLMAVSLGIALSDQDVAVCYWAIDDHRKSIAYRLTAMLSRVPIKRIRNPEIRLPGDTESIKVAQETIRDLLNSRRLSFKDDRFGRSKKKAENWIKDTQDNTSAPILFCIDSLHNIQGSSDDMRTKLVGSSTWAKSLTSTIPCTVIATMEMVKNRIPGKKPNLISLAESGKLEFDFDTIGIVWNEAQGSFTTPSRVANRWGTEDNWKPVIEFDIQKNKAGSGEKGIVYLDFDPETTSFMNSSLVKNPMRVGGNLITEPISIGYEGYNDDYQQDTGW